MTEDEIRNKDVVVITTAHDNVNYNLVVKNARVVFDINNVIKVKNENVEKL